MNRLGTQPTQKILHSMHIVYYIDVIAHTSGLDDAVQYIKKTAGHRCEPNYGKKSCLYSSITRVILAQRPC